MNRSFQMLKAILLVIVFSTCFAASAEALPSGTEQSKDVVKGTNAFAAQLYRELGTKEGNLFFSPNSISSALGMTYAGARGNTAKEMAEALHFQLGQPNLHSEFKDLNKGLTTAAEKNGQRLKIANALVLTGGDVSNEFKTILNRYYDAEIFRGGLNSINDWGKQKTEGKIEKILEELSPDTVCVLLNAIYFKGVWASQFEKSYTADAPFSVSANKEVMVPLMHQKSDFKMMTSGDLQAISIPYKGSNLSMVILLPKSAGGLAALENRLTDLTLRDWLATLDKGTVQKVDLYLPKFKLETRYDLIDSLRKMGMKEAFIPKEADFSGMGWPKGKLWIGQIKHKAFVEVNEEGTEAAAATAVEMVTKSMHHNPVFRADHPFLFIIRDNQTGSIMFMGRLTDPAKK